MTFGRPLGHLRMGPGEPTMSLEVGTFSPVSDLREGTGDEENQSPMANEVISRAYVMKSPETLQSAGFGELLGR